MAIDTIIQIQSLFSGDVAFSGYLEFELEFERLTPYIRTSKDCYGLEIELSDGPSDMVWYYVAVPISEIGMPNPELKAEFEDAIISHYTTKS